MYIRFVIDELHPKSNQKLGIFHAIRYMADEDELSDEEFQEADRLMTWFADNMKSPFEHLNKQQSKKSDIFISWFKDSATEHIKKARELCEIVNTKNNSVEFLRTKQPGKIVYEDKHQIFSKPFEQF